MVLFCDANDCYVCKPTDVKMLTLHLDSVLLKNFTFTTHKVQVT